MTNDEIRDAWFMMKSLDREMHEARIAILEIADNYIGQRGDDRIRSSYDEYVKNESKINEYLHKHCELNREVISALGDIVLVIGGGKVIFVDADGEITEKDLVS